MTDREILIKAVKKANNNGLPVIGATIEQAIDIFLSRGTLLYYGVIFSHDFSKAFFGNNYGYIDLDGEYKLGLIGGIAIRLYEWQYHLQQMVICEKPLQYLARFLEEE